MSVNEGNTEDSVVSLFVAIYSHPHSQQRWARVDDARPFDPELLQALYRVNGATLAHPLTHEASDIMIDRAA